jgi:hypothetical protein
VYGSGDISWMRMSGIMCTREYLGLGDIWELSTLNPNPTQVDFSVLGHPMTMTWEHDEWGFDVLVNDVWFDGTPRQVSWYRDWMNGGLDPRTRKPPE